MSELDGMDKIDMLLCFKVSALRTTVQQSGLLYDFRCLEIITETSSASLSAAPACRPCTTGAMVPAGNLYGKWVTM